MNQLLSDRINNMSTSATLAMAAKARELRNEGKDIIRLSLGEPDFNTPDFIKEAAIQAINENYNSYTPVDGYAELKDAIITKFKRDNNLTYNPSQIVVSTGAKQALANVAKRQATRPQKQEQWAITHYHTAQWPSCLVSGLFFCEC